MLAPANTPAPILERMNREISAVMDLPEVREKMEGLGALPFKMEPAAFDKFIEQEANTLGAVMRNAGAKPQ